MYVAGVEKLNNIQNNHKKRFLLLSMSFTIRTQPVFTWSQLTIETLEQGVKDVQS